MHTVSLAVREFMRSDEVASLAKNTRRRQASTLRLLVSAGTGVTANMPIARLNRSHIDATLAIARDKRLQESSLNAYRVDLRRFGEWLHSCQLVKIDPTRHLRNVHTSTPKGKRRPITGTQARELIEVAERRHPRDGMTAILMLNTGLRESEVIGLRWADIDLPNRSASAYRPKQRDWHTVHMTRSLAIALEKWQAFYEERHGPVRHTWYVVPALAHSPAGYDNGVMSAAWPMRPERRQTDLGQRVKAWLAAVGETDLRGRASHTMRRTAANLLYQKTGDIRTVQMFLGHSSVAMTELYLDVDAAQAKLRSTMEDFDI